MLTPHTQNKNPSPQASDMQSVSFSEKGSFARLL